MRREMSKGLPMNGFLKRFCIAVTAVTALVMSSVPLTTAYARTATSFVMNAETKEILHSYRADTRIHPASLTKMMTLYMTFDALKSGKLKLKQKLTVSRTAVKTRPSWLALRPGQKITVEDAIRGLVTKSANDAAKVLAEAIGGTEVKFAQMMTARARKMGMSRTVFRNASGLPNRSQITTARDMAKLGLALINDFPRYYPYFSQRSFKYGKTTFRNHNKLLTSYPGTDGIKTGFINASGFNLVASVKRNDVRLIGVVIGGRTGNDRNARMEKLFDNAFLKLKKTGQMVGIPMPRLAPADKILPAKAQIAMAILRSSQEAEKKGWTAGLISEAHAAEEPLEWGVQVGAYYDKRRAHQAAVNAAKDLPDLLRMSRPLMSPTKNGSRTLYRARLVGVSEQQAREACRVLKQLKTDCLAVKIQADG